MQTLNEFQCFEKVILRYDKPRVTDRTETLKQSAQEPRFVILSPPKLPATDPKYS